jgi:hypothetical protein
LCEKCQTYLISSGPDKHLFIIVTEEDSDGMHILINVSSIDPDIPHDSTCLLNIGDHKFIDRPSYMAYEFAIQRHKNFVDDRTRRKLYIQHKDANPDLVSRICDGIKKSPFTKRAIKDGYDAALRAEAKRKKQKP